MACPTNQNYFFSAKLDDDEKILECVKINIIYARRKKKGYLAVTNKRYLIADADGVYSFRYFSVTREALFELGLASIAYVFLIFAALLANTIVVWIISLVGIILSILIGLPLDWNKLRVSGTAKFYKSNFTWEVEGGERTELKDFSAIVWSDEVKSKELIIMLKQSQSL